MAESNKLIQVSSQALVLSYFENPIESILFEIKSGKGGPILSSFLLFSVYSSNNQCTKTVSH